MLSLAWRWKSERHRSPLSTRLASSLCSGIGGQASAVELDGISFAYRALRSTPASSRLWRPTRLPSGLLVIFHGYLDNALSVAGKLGTETLEPALLYGLAVERWGDEAEREIVGEYCAVLIDTARPGLRLARSPLRAPPLHYFSSSDLVAAASVPRALFAAGVERRLNEQRVADSALMNFSDKEASWFEEVYRVPLGHVVDLKPGFERNVRQPYDLFSVPDVRFDSVEQYVQRAGELLTEGVRVCMAGFANPGATLSSGLDSPQVAICALNELPANKRLPTFTFHPEPGYDGRTEFGKVGNERPIVEAFLAKHPRIEPHFTDNGGYEHDYRWNEFFHLMGGAPAGLPNMYVFHGLFSAAAKRNCDVILLAEWGNFTFSDKGDWGFVEYLLTGKWRQLWLALTRLKNDDRSLIGKFMARSVSALLPQPIWRLTRRFGKLKGRFAVDLMQPLSPTYRVQSGGEKRLRGSGVLIDRYHPKNRREALKLVFSNGDAETGEIYQAFEQMYGVAQRDPTAYRPFVEFCLGLPTELFLRDGEARWLAKEMAKGIMPEEQRDNPRNGRWDADWHLRIGRRRGEFLSELDGLSGDPRMAAMLDLSRLRAALEHWPDETPTDLLSLYGPEFAVPRALLTARFIKYVEGQNE